MNKRTDKHWRERKMNKRTENTGSNRNREICDINFHWSERKMNKRTDKQYVAVFFFVTQYNSSLSSFVQNFRILTQVVAEKSLTKKCLYVLYKSERREK